MAVLAGRKPLRSHFHEASFAVPNPADFTSISRSDNSLIWMPCHRTHLPPVSSEFLDPFRDKWLEFHVRTIGERISVMQLENSQIETVRFVHPPEPREYYRTRHRALVNLRDEIVRQIEDVIAFARRYDSGPKRLSE